ncbi:MAG: DUF262 domain-containing protein [Gammaproteobacteria bacterium]|nr:DUF262 domain-containing protein [Gammaproteobacteria bacterium]MCY4282539.1 DUF262 domain-containing protein [Gammaproteobacteria bacterium]
MANNELKSLLQIFHQKIFRIPDFQRGYSWQKNQLDDFWQDLVNLGKDKIHYTGLLTVEPVIREDAERSDKWQDEFGY